MPFHHLSLQPKHGSRTARWFAAAAKLACCAALTLLLPTSAPADRHDDLVDEIQKLCDETRNAFESGDCRAVLVDGSEEWAGQLGVGQMGLLRAPDPAKRLGAIVLVLGFSAQLSESCMEGEYSEEFSTWTVSKGQRVALEGAAELWQLGFDVYALDWCDNNTYIQRNSFVLRSALEIVREGTFSSTEVAPLSGDEKLVVIGQSMGGLVSRFALASMEERGPSHGVDMWVAFDAPLEGAYLPIGIQHMAELLDIAPAAGGFFKTLFDKIVGNETDPNASIYRTLRDLRGAETPAARQMLLVHKDGPQASGPTSDFQDLFRELDRIGYPGAGGLRTVAIANGSGGAKWTGSRIRPLRFYGNEDVKKTYTIQYPPGADGGLLDPILWEAKLKVRIPASIEMIVSPLDQALTTMTVFEARVNMPGVYLNDTFIGLGGTVIDADAVGDILDLPDELPKKTILGPVAQTVRDFIDSLLDLTVLAKVERRANVPVAYATVPAGTSGKFKQAKDDFFLRSSGGAEEEPFIPTTSALGLDRTLHPAGADVEALLNSTGWDSPFDQVYFHSEETGHVETTSEVRRWLCDEVSTLAEQPRITSVSPSKRPVGGAEFLITVEGENLHDGMVLVWSNDSTEEEVELVTQLKNGALLATVPAELIDTLPPCRGGFCDPLFPEREPVQISAKDLETGVPSCRSLALSIEESRVTSSPPTPIAGEPFTLTLSDDWRNGCHPRLIDPETPYRIEGRTITIDATTGPPEEICTFAITPYQIQTEIDPLPAGSYEVVYTVFTFGATQELTRYPFLVRNTRPVIATVEPASAEAGAEQALQLTVTGSGFVQGVSEITWDGVALDTQYVDANTLQAALSAEELAVAGTVEVGVASVDAAGPLASEPATFEITPPRARATGSSISSVPVGSGEVSFIVRGQGFTADSVAAWPVSDDELLLLNTEFVDSTQLRVTLPAELAATAGTVPIVIVTGEDESIVTLTVGAAGPLVTDLPTVVNVTDGASYRTVLTPLSFASVFGERFADAAYSATSLPLPYELGGVRVTVNGIPAAVQYASPTQINFQVPGGVATGGIAQVVVFRDGLPGESFELEVKADAFGFFSYFRDFGTPEQSFDPILVNLDGQILSPSVRAESGEIVVAYGTGVSSLDNAPADAAASPSDPPSTCAITPAVTVRTDQAEAPVDVLYCGLTADLVSLVQLNLRFGVLPGGDNPKLYVRFGEGPESEGVPLYLARP